MLTLQPLPLPGLVEVVPAKFGDRRGFFSETYHRPRFVEAGIDVDWVQDNQSFSAAPHTLRGLHYQAAPQAQHKLVRVLRGRIFDVAVDIRKGSPTFGQWAGLELSAAAFNQLFVPVGFAHGFVTLEPDTEVFYKVSAPYSAEHDRAIAWDDPDIAVAWPLDGAVPVLSAKDSAAPRLRDVDPAFAYSRIEDMPA